MNQFASLVLGLSLCAAAGVAGAQVNALPPTRHILVYGEAQAQAIPDRFRITIALERVDPSVDAARRKVEADLRRILARLGEAGVRRQDTNATSLEIGPSERYDRTLQAHVYEGMKVSRMITAHFASTDSLRAFLSGLETSEEVTVSGVETELSTEAAVMKALREKAIADTRTKAEVIAAAYGVRLAGLYSVSDVPPKFDYGIQEGDWPVTFRWNGETSTLDRIQVTGSRLDPSDVESFEAGTVIFEDKIYAVFLISE